VEILDILVLVVLDLVYYSIRDNAKNKKQRNDNQKRKDMQISIDVRLYVDHVDNIWEKKKNLTNNKKILFL
jgi:hypothetical protein